jgi:hypothetical protein
MTVSRMAAIANAGDLNGLLGNTEATLPGGEASEQHEPDKAKDIPPGEAKALAASAGQAAESTKEPEPEADKSEAKAEPEAPKEEPAKPAEKRETEIQKINNQIRALNRKQEAQARKDAEHARTAKELAEKEAALKPLEQLMSLGDLPLLMKVAELKGVPFKDMLRRAISHAATGEPEAQEEKVVEEPKELDPVVKALQEELAGLKTHLSEKEERAKANYEASLLDEYVGSCMELITDNDYPILSGEDPETIAEEILAISEKYATETGEAPEVDEVIQYLEAKYEKKAKSLSERLQKKSGNVKDVIETTNVSSPETGASSPATSQKAATPKALTNDLVSERSSGTPSPRSDARGRLKEAEAFLKSLSR